MVLLHNRGDRSEVLRQLRLARNAMNDVLDHLPAAGLHPDTDNLARGVAENLLEYIDAVVQEVSATRQ